MCLREFVQIGLDEQTPDHVTISRTRRLIDEAMHREVFGWVLRQVARAGLLRVKTVGIDGESCNYPTMKPKGSDDSDWDDRATPNFPSVLAGFLQGGESSGLSERVRHDLILELPGREPI